MLSNNEKLIAVIDATGQQGGAVVRALQARVRALSRNPDTLRYFQAHTYLGSISRDEIALAHKIAGGQPTKFSTWARANFPL
jgi:uncharacterized protein YbjT (DUF2867 family)